MVPDPGVPAREEEGKDLPLGPPLQGEELGEEAPVQGVVLQPSQGVGLLQGVVGLLQPLLPVEGVDLGEEEPGLLGLPLPAEEGLPGEEVNGGVVVPLVQGPRTPFIAARGYHMPRLPTGKALP